MYSEKAIENEKEFDSHLIGKLKLLGLDVQYISANGKYLNAVIDDQPCNVLDLIGGYGASLFGHNHPQIWQAVDDFKYNDRPNFVQMSYKKEVNELSKILSKLLANDEHSTYHTTYTNSGAEAVEYAIKHASFTKQTEIDSWSKQVNSTLAEIRNYYRDSPIKVENADLSFDHYIDMHSYIREHNEQAIQAFEPLVLTSPNSYHGKTISALAITSNRYYQSPVRILPKVKAISLDTHCHDVTSIIKENQAVIIVPKINAKRQISFDYKSICEIIGCFVEPINGEGGIVVHKVNYLKDIIVKMKSHNIPVIVDEIQTGMYRCGHLSLIIAYGLNPDYLLLGKALGGGLAKIASCSIASALYKSEMSLLHSSTFAEDGFSTLVSKTAIWLGRVNAHKIIDTGARWLDHLHLIQAQFPSVIKEVRGCGMLIGIELYNLDYDGSYAFQMLSRSGYLGYVISSYLLHLHHIRVSITLSSPNTLRIHGNIDLDDEDLHSLVEALIQVCQIVKNRDLYCLIQHLLPIDYQNLRATADFNLGKVPVETEEADCEVGFVVHYIDNDTALICEPSLSILPVEVVHLLLNKITSIDQPSVLGRRVIKDIFGKKVGVTFVGLAYTSEMIKSQLSADRTSIYHYRDICNRAVEMCKNRGINTVGLGQFNSIVMRNGKDVNHHDVLVTTGNSLTIYAAYEVAKKHTKDIVKPIVAIVGAGGNIATTLSELIMPHSHEMIIVGSSEQSKHKISQHTQYLRVLDSTKSIKGTWDLNVLIEADIVLIATSSPSAFLSASHFKVNCLIVDLSIPCNCDDSVMNNPRLKFINGGLILLPNAESFDIRGIPLAPGMSFACLAETIITGLASLSWSYSYGSISQEDVYAAGALARRHGFVPVG